MIAVFDWGNSVSQSPAPIMEQVASVRESDQGRCSLKQYAYKWTGRILLLAVIALTLTLAWIGASNQRLKLGWNFVEDSGIAEDLNYAVFCANQDVVLALSNNGVNYLDVATYSDLYSNPSWSQYSLDKLSNDSSLFFLSRSRASFVLVEDTSSSCSALLVGGIVDEDISEVSSNMIYSVLLTLQNIKKSNDVHITATLLNMTWQNDDKGPDLVTIQRSSGIYNSYSHDIILIGGSITSTGSAVTSTLNASFSSVSKGEVPGILNSLIILRSSDDAGSMLNNRCDQAASLLDSDNTRAVIFGGRTCGVDAAASDDSSVFLDLTVFDMATNRFTTALNDDKMKSFLNIMANGKSYDYLHVKDYYARSNANIISSSSGDVLFIFGGFNDRTQFLDSTLITSLQQPTSEDAFVLACQSQYPTAPFCDYNGGGVSYSSVSAVTIGYNLTNPLLAFVRSGILYLLTTNIRQFVSVSSSDAKTFGLLETPSSTVLSGMVPLELFSFVQTFKFQFVMVMCIVSFVVTVTAFFLQRVFHHRNTRHTNYVFASFQGNNTSPQLRTALNEDPNNILIPTSEEVLKQLPTVKFSRLLTIGKNLVADLNKQDANGTLPDNNLNETANSINATRPLADLELQDMEGGATLIIENSEYPAMQNRFRQSTRASMRSVASANSEFRLNPEMNCCCVCLGDFTLDDDLTLLPCGHFFHPDCIATWLKKSFVCPLCKQGVTQVSVKELNTWMKEVGIRDGSYDFTRFNHFALRLKESLRSFSSSLRRAS